MEWPCGALAVVVLHPVKVGQMLGRLRQRLLLELY